MITTTVRMQFRFGNRSREEEKEEENRIKEGWLLVGFHRIMRYRQGQQQHSPFVVIFKTSLYEVLKLCPKIQRKKAHVKLS